ncbi:DUF617 domain containing protein [Musa troglodytarum]|uniref:DUF617 domain containing protein n=1 Tax=Musa troglodytarum TaxID=320322 RepID=A0A9E7GR93_9LILI|nr:DUF617 domain containing protein [Musa troglodytarum]
MQSLLETPGLVSLLRRSTDRRAKMAGGGIFRMFKLRTAFTSGCKMAALAGRPNKSLLSGNSTTITLFGLVEECMWAVYCNGRKSGYSMRKKQASDEERHVMQLLRGVSMGAGVLPYASEKDVADGELTYMRARFEKVVGSKDSEALYMINPDGTGVPELSIFLVRMK